jgi:hypothetical protein
MLQEIVSLQYIHALKVPAKNCARERMSVMGQQTLTSMALLTASFDESQLRSMLQ